MKSQNFVSFRLLLFTVFLLTVISGGLAGRVYAVADIGDAQTMVENTTNRVLETLKQNKERLKNDKQALYRLVDEIIVPHFDFRSMSKLVLGKHWKKANKEQQQRFTEEFKTMLVRTYSTAMLDFTDEEIKYLPVRARGANNSRALSRMEISQPGGGRPAQMSLSMINRDTGWKVYDVTIDGVSLVTNYRQSFSDDVQQSGIEGLIKKLADKNIQRAG